MHQFLPDSSRVAEPGSTRCNRADLVRQTADYILENNGPDNNGLAHPKVKKIRLGILEDALRLAYQEGLSEEIKPFHFAQVFGLQQDQGYQAEMVKRKIENLAAASGSLPILPEDAIKLMTTENLSTNFTERVAGRDLKVNFSTTFSASGSPYEIALIYLRMTGQTELASALKPYHMPNVSKSIYSVSTKGPKGPIKEVIPATALEVLQKQIAWYLRTKHDASLSTVPDIIRNIRCEHLYCGFTEKVTITAPTTNDSKATREVTLTVHNTKAAYNAIGSLYAVLQHFLKHDPAGHPFINIRPYHLAAVAPDTFTGTKGDALFEELYLKKIGAILSGKYHGDLPMMLEKIRYEELISQFSEQIGGEAFTVCCEAQVQRRFGNRDNTIKYLKRLSSKLPRAA